MRKDKIFYSSWQQTSSYAESTKATFEILSHDILSPQDKCSTFSEILHSKTERQKVAALLNYHSQQNSKSGTEKKIK